MDERTSINGARSEGRLIRPYTMTGGRTGADQPYIALEALVSATPTGLRNKHQYRWEAARVIDLSTSQTAIVEIAARLDIPIGVVRVVVADLAHRGAVQISEPPSEVPASLEGYTYTTLLQKVLDGIKSL
jgi:uncharacterized protein DUF742